MKKYIKSALLLVSFTGFSQTFEGIIKYKITASGEKIEKAQKEMSNPENQAKMKQFEAQMKDPNFQKLLESNPQLKEQMENMMKANASGGNMMDAMMPKGSTVYIKGNTSLVKTEGGMEQEILSFNDKNESYKIMRKNKSYKKMDSKADSAQSLVAKKTTETATILNYKCTKYVVTDTKMNMELWCTTDINGIDYKKFKYKNEHGGIRGIEGVPLKVHVKNKDIDMVNEVTEIKQTKVDASLLEIPSDFKEIK